MGNLIRRPGHDIINQYNIWLNENVNLKYTSCYYKLLRTIPITCVNVGTRVFNIKTRLLSDRTHNFIETKKQLETLYDNTF